MSRSFRQSSSDSDKCLAIELEFIFLSSNDIHLFTTHLHPAERRAEDKAQSNLMNCIFSPITIKWHSSRCLLPTITYLIGIFCSTTSITESHNNDRGIRVTSLGDSSEASLNAIQKRRRRRPNNRIHGLAIKC